MLQDEPVFYIDRAEQQVALPVERLINRSQPQLNRADFRHFDQLRLDELGAIDWQQHAHDECILLSFEAFRWLVHQSLSDGQLHPAINASASMRLKHFPDFRALPHTPSQVLLASYLIKHGGDLPTLVERTRLPRDLVVAFVNASFAIGMLHVQQPLFGYTTASAGQERRPVSDFLKRLFG
jgi:hypothetical protein